MYRIPALFFLFFIGLLFFTKAQININPEPTPGISFIPNKGQWNKKILYSAKIPCGQVNATEEGIVIVQYDEISIKQRDDYFHLKEAEGNLQNHALNKSSLTQPSLKGHAFRLRFSGGNNFSKQKIITGVKSTDYYNFLLGNDPSGWATKVYSYDAIIYNNIYDGIDVKYYYAQNGGLENDIIVKPGRDLSVIKFEIDGADSLLIDKEGKLAFNTSIGRRFISAPLSYTINKYGRKTIIKSAFYMDGNKIGFTTTPYDKTETLVIDPIVVRWATMASNNSTSNISHSHGIAVAPNGDIWLTGFYDNSGLITTPGAIENNPIGAADIFVGKYKEPLIPGGNSSRIFQTFIGGEAAEDPYALEQGPDGYIYITGVTLTTNMPKQFGNGISAGNWIQKKAGCFIFKMNPSGTGAICRVIGKVDSIVGIDQTGDMRVLPTADGYDLINCFNLSNTRPADEIPEATTAAGEPVDASLINHPCIVRISNDLNTIKWNKSYSGVRNPFSFYNSYRSHINILSVDKFGNIYAGGSTNSSVGISYNNISSQTTLGSDETGGSPDGWLMKLNSSNGNVQWSRYLNAELSERVNILCMELTKDQQHMIIGGITSGLAEGTTSTLSYQQNYEGAGNDFFIASMPVTGGERTWATYLGGTLSESNMMGLNLDENNNVYILGYSNSTNFPTTNFPLQNSNKGGYDAVFSELSPDGRQLLYSTYYGGTADETDPLGERGIQFNKCRIYLAITSRSDNSPLTVNTLTGNKLSNVGNSEPFIVSMANPPDLSNNIISYTGNTTIACGTSPGQINGSTPSYNIPGIIRNQVVQTVPSGNAYPLGFPPLNSSSYQWQKSIDNGFSWQNIPGATNDNFTPDVIKQTTQFRRIINKDFCDIDPGNIITFTVSNGITLSVNIANCRIITGLPTLTLKASGNGSSYQWTGPNNFSASTPDIDIQTSGFYTATVKNASGCMVSQVVPVDVTACTIVPVKLSSLKAIAKGCTIHLNWTVGEAINFDFFQVERSSNGSSFEPVQTVNYNRNQTNFAFIDSSAHDGYFFYRLKLVDIDGRSKYSTIVSANANCGVKNITVYPNPTKGIFAVYGLSGKEAIRVYDAVGKLIVMKISNTSAEEIDLSKFAKGIYLVTISGKNGNTIQKIIKQ